MNTYYVLGSGAAAVKKTGEAPAPMELTFCRVQEGLIHFSKGSIYQAPSIIPGCV